MRSCRRRPRSASRPAERYVDRARPSALAGSARPWRHPQDAPASRPPSVPPGERYVDREFFGEDGRRPRAQVPLRRGARVCHDRFGEGEVPAHRHVGEPSVVAFFPGWGEKKILARFLKLA